MKLSKVSTAFLIAAVAVCSVAADDDSTDPRYGYWAKAKPGSSATFEGDIVKSTGSQHITMKQELTSITKEAVTLSVTNTITVDGKPKTFPPRNDVLTAKGEKVKWTKEPATVTVNAAGKDYVCDVWSAKVVDDAKSNIRMYVNDSVPGGLVKLEKDDPSAKVKFVLNSFDAK